MYTRHITIQHTIIIVVLILPIHIIMNTGIGQLMYSLLSVEGVPYRPQSDSVLIK